MRSMRSFARALDSWTLYAFNAEPIWVYRRQG